LAKTLGEGQKALGKGVCCEPFLVKKSVSKQLLCRGPFVNTCRVPSLTLGKITLIKNSKEIAKEIY
jgi:hypothetical protein